MKHLITGRKLNRKSSHRKALFKNLSNSLIIHEQIKTTLPKAKDLRSFVEKIITLGKKDSLHSKRKVYSILRDNNSVNKVFNILSKRYMKRNGGYTRVLKAGFRYGDSSPMAVIEFIDRDTNAKGLIDKERIKRNEEELNTTDLKNKKDEQVNSDKNAQKKIETGSKEKTKDKATTNKNKEEKKSSISKTDNSIKSD